MKKITDNISTEKQTEVTSPRSVIKLLLSIIPTGLIEIVTVWGMTGYSGGAADTFYVIAAHILAVLSLLGVIFKPKMPTAFKWILPAVSPFTAFIMLEGLTHNPFKDINYDIILLNLGVLLILAAFILFLTGNTAPTVITVTLIPLIFGLVSYFTVAFRGTPLFPWDIASYGIAATVLGGYSLKITPAVAFIISSAVIICRAAILRNIRIKLPKKFIRPVCAIVLLCVMILTGGYIQTDRAISDFSLYPYLFTPDILYDRNGFTVSFLMNLRYTTVDKPDGYSVSDIMEYAEKYESGSASNVSVKPNVIVIMNESFADMSALCDYETSEECLPFINSLEENTMKGNLHVSIIGGNTPNSEFEFLTGMTLGYLPSGCIPYQQFIKSARPSLATQMNELGYRTVAMHPYWAEGWKRETVYPYLGFDEMYFLDESFPNAKRLRGYVSDEGLYDKIESFYSMKNDGDPMFVFAVTMQNHSAYNKLYDNFTPEITVNGLENNLSLTTYMSLVRESDRAFEGLVNYFSDYDEPTVILMFGDHQPNNSIATPLLKDAGIDYDESNLELSEGRYIVPYILWSNFDMEMQEDYDIDDVSVNYLSGILMDAAGLPKSAYQTFLSEVREDFPVITGHSFIDKNGKITPISEYYNFDKLALYAKFQYNYLFDSAKMSELFWNLKN